MHTFYTRVYAYFFSAMCALCNTVFAPKGTYCGSIEKPQLMKTVDIRLSEFSSVNVFKHLKSLVRDLMGRQPRTLHPSTIHGVSSPV